MKKIYTKLALHVWNNGKQELKTCGCLMQSANLPFVFVVTHIKELKKHVSPSPITLSDAEFRQNVALFLPVNASTWA